MATSAPPGLISWPLRLTRASIIIKHCLSRNKYIASAVKPGPGLTLPVICNPRTMEVEAAQCSELGSSLGTVRPWVKNTEGETTTDKILDWIKSKLLGEAMEIIEDGRKGHNDNQ